MTRGEVVGRESDECDDRFAAAFEANLVHEFPGDP